MPTIQSSLRVIVGAVLFAQCDAQGPGSGTGTGTGTGSGTPPPPPLTVTCPTFREDQSHASVPATTGPIIVLTTEAGENYAEFDSSLSGLQQGTSPLVVGGDPTNAATITLARIDKSTGMPYATATAENALGTTSRWAWNSNNDASLAVATQAIRVTVTHATLATVTCDVDVIVLDLESPSITCPSQLSASQAGTTDSAINMYQHTAPTSTTTAYVLKTAPGSSWTASATVPSATATDNSGTISGTRVIRLGSALDISSTPQTFEWPATTGQTTQSNTGVTNGIPDFEPGGGVQAPTAATLTYYATDPTGNEASCTTAIIVVDLEDPVITCPESLSVTGSTGNQYVHGSAAYVYMTDLNADRVTGATIAPATTQDNADASPDYSVYRKGVYPTADGAFDPNTDLFGTSPDFLWNPASALTTAIAGDADGDGLQDTSPQGGQQAALSAYLSFVARDQSGNRASCIVPIVVVDLQDPVIVCPPSLGLETTSNFTTDVSLFTGRVAERPEDLTNTYVHTGSNVGSVLVYQTDLDSISVTNGPSNTVPPSADGCLSDNSKPAGSAATLVYSVHRKDVLPTNPQSDFSTVDIKAAGQTYSWNALSVGTTRSEGDTNSPPDGLADTVASGGAAAAVSSQLRYVVEDQSGNRASCTMDVVVVDLQDPVITCPASFGLSTTSSLVNDVANFQGRSGEAPLDHANTYVHPAKPYSVFVYQTGLDQAFVSATPPALVEGVGFSDNSKPSGNPGYTAVTLVSTIHRKVGSTYGTDITGASQTYNWDPITGQTTVSVGDLDGDGIADTAPNGGAEAPLNSLLRYVASDQSGNVASCTVDVVVVDLQDPVITCPPSFGINTLSNSAGDNTNTYLHPSTATNINGVFVYPTAAGGLSASGIPTARTMFTDYNDNTKIQAAAYSSVSLTVTTHRKTLFPTASAVFDPSDVTGQSQTYAWNTASTRTTVYGGTATGPNQLSDANNDGIDDTDVTGVAQGGQEAAASAVLRYVVEDQSGNRASCTVDVVVVDLEDPVIVCPDPIQTRSMLQLDGSTNTYAHPTSADNYNRVMVYALDTDGYVASASTMPNTNAPPKTMTDNAAPAAGLNWKVFVRRDFPAAHGTLADQTTGVSSVQDTLTIAQYNAQRMRWGVDASGGSDAHPTFQLDWTEDMRLKTIVYQWNYSYSKGTTVAAPHTGIRSDDQAALGPASFNGDNATRSWFIDMPNVADPATCVQLVASKGCSGWFHNEPVSLTCPETCQVSSFFDDPATQLMTAYGTESLVNSVYSFGSRAAKKNLFRAYTEAVSGTACTTPGNPRCDRQPEHPAGAGLEAGVSAELVYVLSDQSGNRASCRREVVVVDLQDPVTSCTSVLDSTFDLTVMYDGRSCVGANTTGTGAAELACFPRSLSSPLVNPATFVPNDNIADALSWSLPERTDNTQGAMGLLNDRTRLTTMLFNEPTTDFPVADRTTFAPRPWNAAELSSGVGAPDLVANGTVFGGVIPHFFGATGLDRHPVSDMPIIKIRQPATVAANTFEVHYDVFDISGNRASCNFDFQMEGRCSAIYNVRNTLSGVTPGPEGEDHPCEVCASETTPCPDPTYEGSQGCGGGWPETTAGGTSRQMCYPRTDAGVLEVSGTKTRRCESNGVWNATDVDLSDCEIITTNTLPVVVTALDLLCAQDSSNQFGLLSCEDVLAEKVAEQTAPGRRRRSEVTFDCDSTMIDFIAACNLEGAPAQYEITDPCLKAKLAGVTASWLFGTEEQQIYLTCTSENRPDCLSVFSGGQCTQGAAVPYSALYNYYPPSAAGNVYSDNGWWPAFPGSADPPTSANCGRDVFTPLRFGYRQAYLTGAELTSISRDLSYCAIYSDVLSGEKGNCKSDVDPNLVSFDGFSEQASASEICYECFDCTDSEEDTRLDRPCNNAKTCPAEYAACLRNEECATTLMHMVAKSKQGFTAAGLDRGSTELLDASRLILTCLDGTAQTPEQCTTDSGFNFLEDSSVLFTDMLPTYAAESASVMAANVPLRPVCNIDADNLLPAGNFLEASCPDNIMQACGVYQDNTDTVDAERFFGWWKDPDATDYTGTDIDGVFYSSAQMRRLCYECTLCSFMSCLNDFLPAFDSQPECSSSTLPPTTLSPIASTTPPVQSPTVSPTLSPTLSPTTSAPTQSPTVSPTLSPTTSPTVSPSTSPTLTGFPPAASPPPSPAPTLAPTFASGSGSGTGLGGNSDSSSATVTVTQQATETSAADTTSSTDTTSTTSGTSPPPPAGACGTSNCCGFFGGECFSGETGCTVLNSNPAQSCTVGRRSRSRREAQMDTQSVQYFFMECFMQNDPAYCQALLDNLALNSIWASKLLIEAGGGFETGVIVQTYQRCRTNDQGELYDPCQPCEIGDVSSRCKTTNVLVTTKPQIGCRTDLSASFPDACVDRKFDGESVGLFEEIEVVAPSSPGKTPKKSPKTSKVWVPREELQWLMGNSSDLISICPRIAENFVQGDRTPGYAGCGEVVLPASSGGKKGSKGSTQSVVEYACDYVNLTAACTGDFASPANDLILKSCFEVCAALGEPLCTGYSVDLNPIFGTADPVKLYGTCLLYSTPQKVRDHFSSAPTPAPVGKKGSKSSKSGKSPKADPFLQFTKSCGFKSSVLDTDKLSLDYTSNNDFCVDPEILIPPRVVTVGKKGQATVVVYYNESCGDDPAASVGLANVADVHVSHTFVVAVTASLAIFSLSTVLVGVRKARQARRAQAEAEYATEEVFVHQAAPESRWV